MITMTEKERKQQKRVSTVTVSIYTKKIMREWSKLHFPGERKTFDQIIQLLIEESSQKNPDPLRWNLNPLERKVLKLIEDNINTSRGIIDHLAEEEIKTTQRNVQMTLDSLRRKRLIDREKKNWREFQYHLLLKKVD